MSRPLRIEYAGALYHIISRGNERNSIFFHKNDYVRFLDLCAESCHRHHWLCHAYCLMGNHYHLLVETQAPTLSKGMQQLNGTYSRYFNRAHRRVGHLFQGRYKSILVEKQAYLLELARYIVLNPVRAKMVHLPQEWPWSSFCGTAGLSRPHPCLTTDWVLGQFSALRGEACSRYRQFVAEGQGIPDPMAQLKNQIYLGSEQFIDASQHALDPDKPLRDIPRVQVLPARQPFEYYEAKYPDTDRAMVMAYRSGHYTLEQVGAYFRKSRSTVSRKVAGFDDSGKWET